MASSAGGASNDDESFHYNNVETEHLGFKEVQRKAKKDLERHAKKDSQQQPGQAPVAQLHRAGTRPLEARTTMPQAQVHTHESQRLSSHYHFKFGGKSDLLDSSGVLASSDMAGQDLDNPDFKSLRVSKRESQKAQRAKGKDRREDKAKPSTSRKHRSDQGARRTKTRAEFGKASLSRDALSDLPQDLEYLNWNVAAPRSRAAVPKISSDTAYTTGAATLDTCRGEEAALPDDKDFKDLREVQYAKSRLKDNVRRLRRESQKAQRAKGKDQREDKPKPSTSRKQRSDQGARRTKTRAEFGKASLSRDALSDLPQDLEYLNWNLAAPRTLAAVPKISSDTAYTTGAATLDTCQGEDPTLPDDKDFKDLREVQYAKSRLKDNVRRLRQECRKEHQQRRQREEAAGVAKQTCQHWRHNGRAAQRKQRSTIEGDFSVCCKTKVSRKASDTVGTLEDLLPPGSSRAANAQTSSWHSASWQPDTDDTVQTDVAATVPEEELLQKEAEEPPLEKPEWGPRPPPPSQPPPPRMPSEWRALWKEEQRAYYFWHVPTNHTTWDPPAVEGDEDCPTKSENEAVPCLMLAVEDYHAEANGYLSVKKGDHLRVWLEFQFQAENWDAGCAYPTYTYAQVRRAEASGAECAVGWLPSNVVWELYLDPAGRGWAHDASTGDFVWEDQL